MHKVLLILPVVLAGCMASEPAAQRPFHAYEVEPVARDAGWAGCEAEGGSFATGANGGLVCVVK